MIIFFCLDEVTAFSSHVLSQDPTGAVSAFELGLPMNDKQ